MPARISSVVIDALEPRPVADFWAAVLRWDVVSFDAELDRLEALGARRVDVGQGPDVTWVVFADPEGNEFCLLRRTVQEVTEEPGQ